MRPAATYPLTGATALAVMATGEASRSPALPPPRPGVRPDVVGAVIAPPPHRRAPMWNGPVPHSQQRPPLIWLMGAGGGTGVSTLEQVLAPAADCGRRWPDPHTGDSPFVLLVARETITSLGYAHDLLRQYHTGLAGECRVLGLVTCAHQPGREPTPIRRYRRIIDDLLPPTGHWRIGWQPDWPLTELRQLPTWTPGDEPPAKRPDPLGDIRTLATALMAQVATVMTEQRHRGAPS